jgi:hypothetical protein
MSQGRWLKLNVAWSKSAWLEVLSAECRLAWIEMLCYIKTNGVAGKAKAPTTARFARECLIGEESVIQLLKAAESDGALTILSGEWIVSNWEYYQAADSTERVRRFRSKHETLQAVTETGVTSERESEREKEIPPKSPKGASNPNFLKFCEAYPKRSGSLNKAPAGLKFEKLLKDGISPESIIEGAENYRKWARATGKEGTELVAQMTTWLNGRRWEESYEIPNAKTDSIEFRKKPLEGVDRVLKDIEGKGAIWVIPGTSTPFDEQAWAESRRIPA